MRKRTRSRCNPVEGYPGDPHAATQQMAPVVPKKKVGLSASATAPKPAPAASIVKAAQAADPHAVTQKLEPVVMSNPAKKKKGVPSPGTAKVIDAMVRLMKERPDSIWHPSSFTFTMRGYRGNISPAVRWLKGIGAIKILALNYDNQPLYGPSDSFLAAMDRKRTKTGKIVHAKATANNPGVRCRISNALRALVGRAPAKSGIQKDALGRPVSKAKVGKRGAIMLRSGGQRKKDTMTKQEARLNGLLKASRTKKNPVYYTVSIDFGGQIKNKRVSAPSPIKAAQKAFDSLGFKDRALIKVKQTGAVKGEYHVHRNTGWKVKRLL